MFSIVKAWDVRKFSHLCQQHVLTLDRTHFNRFAFSAKLCGSSLTDNLSNIDESFFLMFPLQLHFIKCAVLEVIIKIEKSLKLNLHLLHSNLILSHLHVYTVNIAKFISIAVHKEIILFVVTLPLWFVPQVLYFVSHFVSLVFIFLIIFRVQIKKGGAYSQLSTLQQTLKYFTSPLLVLLGLKLLAFK